MAVTKIKSIKATPKKAIDYIIDKKKTNGQILISSFGCSPDTADIEFKITEEYSKVILDKDYSKQSKNKAYHVIQSFSIDDNVSSELAHEIGIKLADELTKGKYQYVISTHIDKGHIHNHIIFNARSFEDFKKFDCNKYVYLKIRDISDKLCLENGLSIIDYTQSREPGKSYKEWSENKKGTSWKSKLKETIDNCIKEVNSYEEFLTAMKNAGYEFKEGKHLAFRATAEGQQRFTRSKTLGINYTEEKIKERILKNREQRQNLKFNRLVGHKRNVRTIKFTLDKQLIYYSRRQDIREVKELANLLLKIRQENILSEFDFKFKIDELRQQSKKIKGQIKELDSTIRSYNEIAKYVYTVERTKDIYEKYEKSLIKKSYYAKHQSEITAYEFARKKIDQLKINPNLTSEQIIERAKQFNKEIDALRLELNKTDQRINELIKIRNRANEIIQKGKERTKEMRKRQQEREI